MRLFSKIFGKPHRRIVVGSRTGKSKKFPLHLPKRTFFTVVVVNSGQNTPPQSLYWWSKPVYPQTRAAEESGSFLEQDSTTVPKFAYRSFCPGGNLVGECLPQTLLMRLTPLENLRKFFSDFFKNSSAAHPVFLLRSRQAGAAAPSPGRKARSNNLSAWNATVSGYCPTITICCAAGSGTMPPRHRTRNGTRFSWKPCRNKPMWNICWMCCCSPT